MYNSSITTNQDDTDLTMIDPSYFQGDNNQPISNSVVKHLQQVNQSRSQTHDYNHAEKDRLEAAEQIERILNFYRQELKQDSNTQLDCNQQLIIRLVDFIRPIYSSKKKKLLDLDALYDEISLLQTLPFIEQREKMEQLNNEIQHLKKVILTSENENNHTMTKVYQINSMVNYEQWMEMEEETKKLHNLVETQRDKINELIKIISQKDEEPVSTEPPTTYNPSVTSKIQESTPDILPQPHVGTVTSKKPNEEPLITTGQTLPRLSRIISYNYFKKCPICNYEFLSTIDDFEIYTHIENCITLSDSNNIVPPGPNQYLCPKCNQQIPGNDEVYLQHLTECFNEHNDTA